MNEQKKNFVDVEKELESYKQFAFGKNLLNVAVALILATSVQKFVSSISDHLLMPLINYFISKADGDWRNLILVPVEGMNLEIGKFGGAMLEFFITTMVLYILYTKIIKRIDPEAKLEAK